MLSIIFLIVLFLGTLWYYVKSFKHPKGFPPGPRLSLPIMGDAYILGEDFAFGFTSLIRKYGKTVGLWLGSNRAKPPAHAPSKGEHDLQSLASLDPS